MQFGNWVASFRIHKSESAAVSCAIPASRYSLAALDREHKMQCVSTAKGLLQQFHPIGKVSQNYPLVGSS